MSDAKTERITPEILEKLLEQGGRFEFSVDKFPERVDNHHAYELRRLSQELCKSIGYEVELEKAFEIVNTMDKSNLVRMEYQAGDMRDSYVELEELGYEIANQISISSTAAEISKNQNRLVYNQILQNQEVKYLTAILAVGTLASVVEAFFTGRYGNIYGVQGKWIYLVLVGLAIGVLILLFYWDRKNLPEDPTG